MMARLRPETLLPQRIADDRDRILPRLRSSQPRPLLHRDAEDIEVIAADEQRAHALVVEREAAFRLTIVSARRRDQAADRTRVLTQMKVFRERELLVSGGRAAIVDGDLEERRGIGDGPWPKEQGTEHGEQAGVDADADS